MTKDNHQKEITQHLLNAPKGTKFVFEGKWYEVLGPCLDSDDDILIRRVDDGEDVMKASYLAGSINEHDIIFPPEVPAD